MTTRARRSTTPAVDPAAIIAQARAQIESAARVIHDLEVRLARGTGDVTEDARRASGAMPALERPATLPERVEAFLRTRAARTPEIAAALDAPATKVSTVIRALSKGGRLANLGTDTDPEWFLRGGEDASPAERRDAMLYLLSRAPMSHRDLLDATGARHGQVQGVLVEMQRKGMPLVNVGDPRRALWFLAASKARAGATPTNAKSAPRRAA